jgi:Cu+-exporting ATPase
MVYRLLDKSGLCEYYALNDRPGITQRSEYRKDKFLFLDDEDIARKLITFQNEEQTHVCFYLPQMHCSSCLYLLEHLYRLEDGIVSCRVDFAARQAFVVFRQDEISLREVADLLAEIGYEPYISLQDLGQKKPAASRANIYRLGIAGFCFANIMLISFPEYLGLDVSELSIRTMFRWLNLLLSMPVLVYSAQPFYISAWKGLRGRVLNIDAPIALAILVTFSRSIYEVLSATGGGYFDSMTGIVFFMLAGRVLQDKTYRQLSFERDYTAYFPIAVAVLKEDGEVTKSLPEIVCGDTLKIHHGELIPADGILTKGKGLIDYSFVTGESLPVVKEIGELVYAGGRQTGGAMEVLVVKEVTQSYLTGLWNRQDGVAGRQEEKGTSFVHFFSRWFTYIVFGIAIIAATYWGIVDPGKIWNAVTAVLIVACPCALLLSSTFTNGNILRILSRNKCYLRNAQVIENMADTTHIVFDKTGTLTAAKRHEIQYAGAGLSRDLQNAIGSLAAQSAHPLSRTLATYIGCEEEIRVREFREIAGMGVEGVVNGQWLRMGNRIFVTGESESGGESVGTRVYVALGGTLVGYYSFGNQYRETIHQLVDGIFPWYGTSVLSGDNDSERWRLEKIMGKECRLLFDQSPADKSDYIAFLQSHGEKVMMIGDGLNDAGALRISNTGIALTDDFNNFTPASDVILDAGRLSVLPSFIRLCRAEKKIILFSFFISILYNIIGLSFAVRGTLSPMVAAILMPASSLSILLLTYGSSNLAARRLNL